MLFIIQQSTSSKKLKRSNNFSNQKLMFCIQKNASRMYKAQKKFMKAQICLQNFQSILIIILFYCFQKKCRYYTKIETK